MKVFIVKGNIDYEGFQILHVCKTKKIAEDKLKKHEAARKKKRGPLEMTKAPYHGTFDSYNMEEFEVEEK